MAVGKNKQLSKGKKGGKKKSQGETSLHAFASWATEWQYELVSRRLVELGAALTILGHHARFCTDPFAKKDWYDIKAPTTFQVRNAGKTLVSRTAGTKVRVAGRENGLTPPHALSPLDSKGMWLMPPPCAQIASESLKGRVFEVSLADLQKVTIN